MAGHWGRGLQTNNKNSIQSRTFDHAGAPPPHPSGHLGSSLSSLSLVQPQHRSFQEGEGSGTKFLEPSAVFLVAAKSRELERKGSAGPHQTPALLAPPSLRFVAVSLKQGPHLGLTSRKGPGMRTHGPPDGLTRHRQLKSRQLGQLVNALQGGYSRLYFKEPQSQSRGMAGGAGGGGRSRGSRSQLLASASENKPPKWCLSATFVRWFLGQ